MKGVKSPSQLPAKQTTKHVAQKPLPEGGVNPRGYMKFRDKNTGRLKYVEARIGMALDSVGNLTHKRF